MRNVFLKTLGVLLLLLVISNNIFATWPGNYNETEWNWNYKQNPTISVPSSCQLFATSLNWSNDDIFVYACPTLGTLSDATKVGTGSFIDNYTKIETNITSYLSDKYYVVVIPWLDRFGQLQITDYIVCKTTHKDSFTASVSKSITNACESNFSAGVSATVKGGSGSYTAAWSTTNGTWYQGAQF